MSFDAALVQVGFRKWLTNLPLTLALSQKVCTSFDIGARSYFALLNTNEGKVVRVTPL